MKMRLGCFGYIKDLDLIAAAGFDCAELQVKEIMALSEEEFKKAKKTLKNCGITAEVFDNPIPLDCRISSPSFDLAYYRDFLEEISDRTAEMGARYIVFGNGKARSLPSEGDIASATSKFDDFFISLLEITAKRNITVLIEPLAKSLSNIVNSLSDAVEFIKKYKMHNLKTLLDYRWMVEEGWPLTVIEDYELYIKHVHIDNPFSPFPTRIVPRLNDGFDYTPFMNTLKNIAYKEIISIEASVFQDFAKEIREGLGLFRANHIEPYRSLS